VLEIRDVTLAFGKVSAVDHVSLDVRQEEILGVIGPNGAGKTSLLNLVSGLYRPHSGKIVFAGQDITSLPPYTRARLGIGRTFQGGRAYLGMTVVENILAGMHTRLRSGAVVGFMRWPWGYKEELWARQVAEEIIDFLDLEPYRERVVRELGFGLRKRVDLGRALALAPRLLLLDEPMAGMSIDEKEDMCRFILDVREFLKIPIVLVEHDMEVVMDLCDRVVVMDLGRVISEGPPEMVKRDPAVIRAYVGVTS
jgi:branched-chain amino acid transport system ATP-binding protein